MASDVDRPIAASGGPPADEPPIPSQTETLGGESNPELLPEREPFRSALHWIGILEQVVASLLLLAILVLVLTQVVLRYVPGALPWTGELARLSMVWATFVIAGYLAAVDRHIAIHVVDHVLRGRGLALVRLFVNLVVLVTCIVFLFAIYQLLSEDIGQVTAAGEIPLFFVNAVPIVGFALTALRAALAIGLVDLPALRGRAEQ